MGTSSSYRSPQTPRWRAFNRALDAQLPLERLSIQLFLAGEPEWQPALDDPALAAFAEALREAHSRLADQLQEADRPGPVIADVVRRARQALFAEDFSVALPVAERALRSVLLETLQGDTPIVDSTSREAAESWTRNRGTPERLVHRFIAHMFSAWAEHVAARDTARLVDFEARDTAAISELCTNLSRYVGEVAERALPIDRLKTPQLGDVWTEIVDAVFAAGRRLEPIDGA